MKLFEEVWRQDCEGIIAKWAHGAYHTNGQTTSWLKVKNREYSQMTGRRELFERRNDKSRRRRYASPILCSELAAVSVLL